MSVDATGGAPQRVPLTGSPEGDDVATTQDRPEPMVAPETDRGAELVAEDPRTPALRLAGLEELTANLTSSLLQARTRVAELEREVDDTRLRAERAEAAQVGAAQVHAHLAEVIAENHEVHTRLAEQIADNQAVHARLAEVIAENHEVHTRLGQAQEEAAGLRAELASARGAASRLAAVPVRAARGAVRRLSGGGRA